MTVPIADRVVGCLRGVATGDAIGKQTEMLAPDEVTRWYPNGVRSFEGEPNTVIPRYVGNSKREWRVGETTDDTERTIAVAHGIIADGTVSHSSIGREMLACTKCVHPGVQSLWEFHQARDPCRTATAHDGCGAAIRVAPVGVFFASQCLDELVSGAYEASISTHGGSLAIAAAAANAAAVSAAIDGASGPEILELALTAASHAESRWPGASPKSTFTMAVRAAYDDLASLPMLRAHEIATRWFPNHPLRIVPLALALATIMHSAEEAILLAANVGGDSDSVASIAGGILEARFPTRVPRLWYEVVESVNGHDLAKLGHELLSLRRSCSPV